MYSHEQINNLATVSELLSDDHSIVDFAEIIKYIKMTGLNGADIARHCGCSESAISKYQNSSGLVKPSYYTGVALVNLKDRARKAFDGGHPGMVQFIYKVRGY